MKSWLSELKKLYFHLFSRYNGSHLAGTIRRLTHREIFIMSELNPDLQRKFDEARERMGTKHLIHPSNRVQRKTPMPSPIALRKALGVGLSGCVGV